MLFALLAAGATLVAAGQDPSPVSSNFTCGVGSPVDTAPIAAAVRSIYDGRVECKAPPNTCARLTCDQGAAITLCNDRSTDLDLPCAFVGDNVVELLVQCEKRTSDKESTVQGRIAELAGTWNVVVDQASC